MNDLLVISPYPPQSGKYNHQKSALASFSANLIEGIQKNNPNLKITILADYLQNEVKKSKKNNLSIWRLWKKNDPVIFIKLLIWLWKTASQKVLIHYEWNVFGSGLYYIVLFPFFLALLKIINIKTNVVVHGVLKNTSNLNIKGVKGKILTIGARIFYYLTIIFADKIIVTEQKLKQDLLIIKNVPKKIAYIPHGVDTFLPVIKKEEARKILGLNGDFISMYFGFLSYYKGPDILINLFKTVSNNGLLYLVGGPSQNYLNDKTYKHFLDDIYKQSNNLPHIKITGFIKSNLIPIYLNACDLMIFPYRDMLSSSGPLSLSFTFEKPFLLSYNLDGYFESQDFQGALKKTGINKDNILFNFTPDDFQRKLIWAKKHIKELCQFSRLMKEKRSWNKVAKQYYKFIYFYERQ